VKRHRTPTGHRPRTRPAAKPKSLILGLTLAEKVADRSVTLLYLPVKSAHHFKRYSDGSEPGAIEADRVPVRAYVGGPVLCHVRIVHVHRREPASKGTTGMPAQLGTPNVYEAQAAGYRDVGEFKLSWVREHDYAWWTRLRDSLDGAEPTEGTLDRAFVRYDSRHAHRPCWALTIRVEAGEGHGRFLLAAGSTYDPRRDPTSPMFDRTLAGEDTLEDLGYTTSPARSLSDAGEVPTVTKLDLAEAKHREEQRLAMVKFEREYVQPLSDRIAEARRAARVKGLGMREEFHRLDWLVRKRKGAELRAHLALIESQVFPRIAA
jgi:hypothetical protein